MILEFLASLIFDPLVDIDPEGVSTIGQRMPKWKIDPCKC